MSFSPELADIRFGCGVSPRIAAPGSAQEVLDRLQTGDVIAGQFPIERYDQFRARHAQYAGFVRQRRKAKGTGKEPEYQRKANEVRKEVRRAWGGWLGQSLLRWTWTEQGFRERLVSFWADHFTAMGKAGVLKFADPTYVEEAIRPNVTGHFADILIAVVTHPLMLHYLDQDRSAGPGSEATKRRKRLGGMNENLAREVLELHTLGVGGPYNQDDVRQLAELFTGLTHNARDGFQFRGQMAEPGSQMVLGKVYGRGKPSLDHIMEVLQDLAVHPVTARHLCRKLVVHFISDAPEPALVDHMTARFLQTGGDLMQVCTAMLEHPQSWQAPLRNVKPPFAFVASACRALAVDPALLQGAGNREMSRNFAAPLAVMGQSWLKPGGPDGWPEEDEAWITPQGLAARMRWAMAAPQKLQPDLPDPRGFHNRILGAYTTPEVKFAAGAAETRAEAIGLILMSPGFQRR